MRPAHALEARLKGYVKAQAARDLKDDDPREDTAQGLVKLFVESKVNTGPNAFILLSGKTRYRSFLSREIAPTVEGAFDADLHELYAASTFGPVDFRIGLQTMTWAENLLISPLDSLNPPDLRYALDPDADDTKLPVLAAKADWYVTPDLELELIWIPFFREAGFDLFGRDEALLKHEVLTVELPGQDPLVIGDDPSSPLHDAELQRRINAAFKSTDFPDQDLSASEFGYRLVWTTGDFLGAVSYFYGHDDLPTIDAAPEFARAFKDGVITLDELLAIENAGAELNITFLRHQQAGGSLNYTWLDTNWGIEASYTTKRSIYDRDLTRYDRPYSVFGAGADRLFWGSRLMLGTEGIGLWFHDLPKDADLLLIRNPLYALIGLARLMILDEDLTVELRAIAIPPFGEGILNPRVEYTLTDHWKAFGGGTAFLLGEPSGLFLPRWTEPGADTRPFPELSPIGYLQANSELFLGMKYLF